MCGTIQGDLYVRSNISTIRNYLNEQGGPANSNRYIVTIPPPKGLAELPEWSTESLSILCETANLPGLGFETSTIPDIGPPYVYPFDATFEDFYYNKTSYNKLDLGTIFHYSKENKTYFDRIKKKYALLLNLYIKMKMLL